MKTCDSCGKVFDKRVFCNSTCRMRYVRAGAQHHKDVRERAHSYETVEDDEPEINT